MANIKNAVKLGVFTLAMQRYFSFVAVFTGKSGETSSTQGIERVLET